MAAASRAPRDPEGRHRCPPICSATTPSDRIRARRTRSAVGAPARLATNFFADTPFSGQVNLLTTGSFDSPQQLFSADNFAHSTPISPSARRSASMPTGPRAPRSRRATSRRGSSPASTRRARPPGIATTSASPTARSATTAATSPRCATSPTAAGTPARSTGSTRFRSRRSLTLTYGGRYARYDYLEDRSLFSPRVALTRRAGASTSASARCSRAARSRRAPRSSCRAWTAASGCRRSGRSRRWSSGSPLEAERTNHVEFEVERDIAAATRVAARVPPARGESAGHAVRRRHAGRAVARSATTSSATSATSTRRASAPASARRLPAASTGRSSTR